MLRLILRDLCGSLCLCGESGCDMKGVTCPNCHSDRSRRGGRRIWTVYVALIAAAILAVLIARLHAGLVAGIVLAVIVFAHLVFDERVCLDCGAQWRPRRDDN